MKEQILALLPSLRRFAWSLTNTAHDADDLLQSTVERLLSRPIPEGAHLGKWAFTVCRNLWIDECRSRRTRAQVPFEVEQHDQASNGAKAMEIEFDLQRVNEALSRLPEDQHLVLSMVTVQGLSYREAAEELGIPVGTVMSRIARARGRLVELLRLEDAAATYELH